MVRTEPESLRNWFTSSQPHSSGPRLSGAEYLVAKAARASTVVASGCGVSCGLRTSLIPGARDDDHRYIRTDLVIATPGIEVNGWVVRTEPESLHTYIESQVDGAVPPYGAASFRV